MRILVSGSTGLIGSELTSRLRAGGHDVLRLVRSSANTDRRDVVGWDIDRDTIEGHKLEGVDAVVHLAGESIASGRWTPDRRRRIRDSRTRGTTLLSNALAKTSTPPGVFVSASAVGIYGDSAANKLDETSPSGSGFLADVCRDWEAATVHTHDAGIRTVHTRFGVVLSPDGGALAKMLPPFRMGLGGRLGDGEQYMSWIALTDAVRAIEHAITSDTLHGPVNITAPDPVTNAEFACALGHALRRPAIFPVPAFALTLLFGEMARETMLASQKALPARLLADGFAFAYPTLPAALASML